MNILSAITDLWLKQVKLCTKAKKRDFDLLADRAWHFYGQTYTPLNLGADEDQSFPEANGGQSRQPTLNKSWEFVALMMPYVHAKVPNRLATPDRPPLPMELAELETKASQEQRAQDKLRAWLLQFWLNHIPTKGYDLSTEIRTALPEALVKGRALLWHELIEGPHELMPASLYGSVDDLLIDADCEQWRDAGFIIRRRKQAVWRIAEEFGLDADKLRGQYTSHMGAAADLVNRRDTPAEDKGDVAEYFEVWSRMGPGHKLVAAPEEMKGQKEAAALNDLGPHVWLAVMPGVEHPLNLKPGSFATAAELKSRTEWPLAFFEDPSNPFPVSRLDFFPCNDSPWATTPLKGGLPWQIFLDSMYHYMKARVRTTCRDIIVCAEAVEESLKEAIESGRDQEIVTVTGTPGEDLSKLIEILTFPPVQRDVWQMMQSGERMFEQATGMTPLMYGSQGEGISRSAEDIRTREGHVTSRPDDMADIVEAWMSAVASKEAQATRLYVPPPYELFGEPRPVDENDTETELGPLSQNWSALVTTDDPAIAASEVSYSVESGSGRRKNKQKQMADVQQLAQTFGPELYQYGVAYGNFGPHRALVEMVGEAYDVPVGRMMLPDVQPEPPEGESKSKSKSKGTSK